MHPIVIAQQKHRASAITVESDRTRKLMITLAARAFESDTARSRSPSTTLCVLSQDSPEGRLHGQGHGLSAVSGCRLDAQIVHA